MTATIATPPQMDETAALGGHHPLPDAVIPDWPFKPETEQWFPVRSANFWRRLPDAKVKCDLCYRNCELEPGQKGWCGVRSNLNGQLVLGAHGVLSAALPYRRRVQHVLAGAPALFLAGMACTAGCAFCISTDLVHQPHKVAWGEDMPLIAGRDSGWSFRRAMLHPKAAIEFCQRIGATAIDLGSNEPTVSYEWTYDVAKLAHEAGINVCVLTNGFSNPAAVRALAPFVDAVLIGIKGHGDAQFYERRMRSPGAFEHAKASAETWHAAGVPLLITDIAPPPHWMEREQAAEALHRMSAWVAASLGADTPTMILPMVKPQVPGQGPSINRPLLPKDSGPEMRREYWSRLDLSQEVAASEGLRYVATRFQGPFNCADCGGLLIGGITEPEFEVHVTGGHCDWCGVAVPFTAVDQETATIAAEAWGGDDGSEVEWL